MIQYRQGDVLLVKVNSRPNMAKLITGKCILAYGEATGHAHTIEEEWAALWEAEGRRYVEITEKPATVVHQEHTAIVVEPGIYEVVRQREYQNENEFTRVRD